MIADFVEKWDNHREDLEQYIRATPEREYAEDYISMVRVLFDKVINRESHYGYVYDTENIKVIDDGNYQGTLIFILHIDSYQPEVREYVYTSVDYGSCTVCDTLKGIYGQGGLPTEDQVKDYMVLFLHLLQRCHRFKEG